MGVNYTIKPIFCFDFDLMILSVPFKTELNLDSEIFEWVKIFTASSRQNT